MIRRRRPLARNKRRKRAYVRHGVRLPDGSTVYTSVPLEWIKACPHRILEMSHYHEDGDCRCGDFTHRDMKEWGYKWNYDKGVWVK